MASISLKNIYKIYPGDVTAVSDFNLEIEDKEFIILVGPSGCGKSTTLRMIAGLEEISKGELYIGDRLVNDVPPKDRDIAKMCIRDRARTPRPRPPAARRRGNPLHSSPRARFSAHPAWRRCSPARPGQSSECARPASSGPACSR